MLRCLWSANAVASDKSYIVNFSCESAPFGLHLPASYLNLLRIAPVKSNAVTETENWEGYTTGRRDIAFDGLFLRVITFSNDPERYMVALATVTGNGHGMQTLSGLNNLCKIFRESWNDMTQRSVLRGQSGMRPVISSAPLIQMQRSNAWIIRAIRGEHLTCR